MHVGQKGFHFGPSQANGGKFQVFPAVVTRVNDGGTVNVEIYADDERRIPAYGQDVTDPRDLGWGFLPAALVIGRE